MDEVDSYAGYIFALISTACYATLLLQALGQ
jgi:hypothetical protein